MAGTAKEVWVMTWRDCINPFNKPPHAHDFNLNTKQSTILYANSLCPMCWHELTVKNHPITAGYGSPAALKQCGSDTL